MAEHLTLHIPTPPTRPGDAPDFSYLQIPPRAPCRVPSLSRARANCATCRRLIRVLDGDGRAVGAWKPAIAPQRLRDGLHAMLLTRLFEERMFRSHRQGKTSFFMKSTGEEAIGAAQSMVLSSATCAFPPIGCCPG